MTPLARDVPAMRVVFFGTPAVAVPALDALVAAPDIDVLAVVTNPDRPRGRSRTPQPSPVKQAALAHEIDVWQPERGRDVRDALAAVAPDVAAVVAYGSLLPGAVLSVPAHGFVNLHFSLLPRWRGAAPVQHAIAAGDRVTGVTTFVLDEGMDTGPLLARQTTMIGQEETSGDLLDRLATDGAPVLVESLRGLVDGHLEPVAQPDRGITLAGKLTPDDVRIDFTRPAADVAAHVRAAAPRPGAHTTWEGERFKVLAAIAPDDGPVVGVPEGAAPGTLVAADGAGLWVACGTGVMLATRVQPAGKAAMEATAFVNGRQPEPGIVLGS